MNSDADQSHRPRREPRKESSGGGNRPIGKRSRDPLAATCPTCGRRFLRDESPTPPFCSERCQLVDLGRWLDEEIGLPYEGPPGETPVDDRDPDETDPEPRRGQE